MTDEMYNTIMQNLPGMWQNIIARMTFTASHDETEDIILTTYTSNSVRCKHKCSDVFGWGMVIDSIDSSCLGYDGAIVKMVTVAEMITKTTATGKITVTLRWHPVVRTYACNVKIFVHK